MIDNLGIASTIILIVSLLTIVVGAIWHDWLVVKCAATAAAFACGVIFTLVLLEDR